MAPAAETLPEGTNSIIDDSLTSANEDTPFEATGGESTGAGASADGDDNASTRDAFKQKFAEATAGFKEQAGEKARAYAAEGKDKATDALDNLAKLVNDAAGTVDQQVGAQYGDYARKAADLVSGLSSSLQAKDVDALVADAGEFVRKSPAVAIGAAAALGFVLVRLVKSGIEGTVDTASSETKPGEDKA